MKTVQPLLIIVGGAPATGKTTLGQRIAREFGLPFVGKDDIKETLFDTLGTGDRDWSRKLGEATYALLYYVVATHLSGGHSLVVESNFRVDKSTQEFLDLRQRYLFNVFQILCRTDKAVVLDRYRERWRSGERHPGHVDEAVLSEMYASELDDFALLPLEGDAVTLDTTEFERIDYQAVFDALRERLRRV